MSGTDDTDDALDKYNSGQPLNKDEAEALRKEAEKQLDQPNLSDDERGNLKNVLRDLEEGEGDEA